uniref:Uncharacterized protein n=1 Tax=Arundo donax TaxID=35708 RepID=A0A0A9AA38_ARUDO
MCWILPYYLCDPCFAGVSRHARCS